MPFLVSIPRGLSASIKLLDSLEASQQRSRVEAALLKMFGRPESLELAPSSLSSQQEQDLREALLFVFRCAESAKVSPEDFFSEVSMLTPLGDASAQLLAKVWAQKAKFMPGAAQGDAETEASATTAELGTLLGVDWVLGVSMSSSWCARVQAPYVSVNFRIAAGQGKVENRTVELSVADFQKLKREFEAVGEALERS